MAPNLNARTVEYPTYVDLAMDVKPWKQIPQSDTSKDLLLQLVTDAACQWVQAEYFAAPIGATTYHRRFDGWTGFMGSYIMLPFTPVLEVATVIEYRGASGAFTLQEMGPTDTFDGYQVVYQTGRLNRVFPGNIQRPFFGGSRNIEVTWTAGYNPIPANIKMATLNLINVWYTAALQQSAMGGRGGLSATGTAQHTDATWGEIPDWIIDQFGGSAIRVSMG